MENDGHEKKQIHRRADHRFIKQAEAGLPIKELCQQRRFQRRHLPPKWRAKYGGMDVPMRRRLRELEAENASSRSCGRGSPGHPCAPTPQPSGKRLAPQVNAHGRRHHD
ncbi:MAG: transposase [Simplicispira sp.]|nr:transposase [Simplicispira sp.]